MCSCPMCRIDIAPPNPRWSRPGNLGGGDAALGLAEGVRNLLFGTMGLRHRCEFLGEAPSVNLLYCRTTVEFGYHLRSIASGIIAGVVSTTSEIPRADPRIRRNEPISDSPSRRSLAGRHGRSGGRSRVASRAPAWCWFVVDLGRGTILGRSSRAGYLANFHVAR